MKTVAMLWCFTAAGAEIGGLIHRLNPSSPEALIVLYTTLIGLNFGIGVYFALRHLGAK